MARVPIHRLAYASNDMSVSSISLRTCRARSQANRLAPQPATIKSAALARPQDVLVVPRPNRVWHHRQLSWISCPPCEKVDENHAP
jgi:hypothetical protein